MMHALASSMVGANQTLVDDAIIGLALALWVVVLFGVSGIVAGLAWRQRFGRFRSTCEHVLQKPHGRRMSEEGLTYSCAKCNLVIRRRDDDWPPWCSEHPGPVVGRQAPTEFWTCGWPRCIPHHGMAGWLRYWRDLVRRWAWFTVDRSMENWWHGRIAD